MFKKLCITAILVVLFFIPFKVFANVVINEVLYDPDGTDTGLEYIILYNNDNLSVDATGYHLNAVSGDYYTFPSFTLNSKSSVAIHWRKDGTNTQTDLYTGTSGFDDNMGNTSGWVALFKNTKHTKDSIIDYIEYGAGGKTYESKAVDAGIWTTGAFILDVNEGKALKLKTDGIDNNSPSDWMETEPSITQEESESTTEEPEAPPIFTGNNPPIADAGDNIIAFINQEIKFDGTKSTDPDNDELAYSWNMGDGKLIEKPSFTYIYNYPGTYLVTLMVYDGQYYVSDTITIEIQVGQIIINEFLPNPSGKDEEEEWIEIYNDSDSIIDISDWQLDDEASGSAPFIFPQNTLIAPKSYIIFSRQITSIALNNDKDSVRLLLPEGVIFQEINYEKPPQGKSSARTEEGFVWSVPTPGLANIISPAMSSETANKTFVYQRPVESELTKEPSQEYVINYQNTNQPEIEGGYAVLPMEKEPQQQDIKSQLAAAKESISKQSPLQLILIIAAIIIAGLIIGLLLVKFRRKSHQSTSFP